MCSIKRFRYKREEKAEGDLKVCELSDFKVSLFLICGEIYVINSMKLKTVEVELLPYKHNDNEYAKYDKQEENTTIRKNCLLKIIVREYIVNRLYGL